MSDPIIDCHQHFFDARRFRYPIFAQRSAAFEALVGDYSSLPRSYLPEDYSRDTEGFNVVQTVCPEFISDDPLGEVRWLNDLEDGSGRPRGIIPRVDFLDPELNRVLDTYGSLGKVRCIRQHLGWHPTNPALRSVDRADLLTDAAWQRGIGALRGRGLACELELFSPQLPELASLAARYPDIQFILPLIGWPVDLSSTGWSTWKRDLTALSSCSNVAVKIFAMECIFGVHWTLTQVRPWILETIAIFGPDRCMFASHLPLCKLARSFQQVYGAYFEIVAEFSSAEKRQMLHDTAAKVYGLPALLPAAGS